MATASDDFNRTNGGIGGNWTQVSGAWTVSANAANQTSTGGQYRTAVYTATPPATNDYTVSANVVNNDGGVGVGVIARASSSAVTCYLLVGFAGDSFYLVRLAAGVENVLATMSGMTSGVTYLVELEVNGTTIRGRIDGGAWTSVTDSNLASGGWGLGSYGAITGGSRWIDDFAAADLSGGTIYTESGSGVCGFVASGSEFERYTDTGAGVCGCVGGGVDIHSVSDAGGAVFGAAASGAGGLGYIETGSAVWGALAAGGDALAMASDGSGVFGFNGYGVDQQSMANDGAAVWGGIGSGAGVFTSANVGAGVFGWVATGADSYVPAGGVTYDETGAAVLGWVVYGDDILAVADGGYAAGALAAGGVGAWVGVDGGGAAAPWGASGQERQTMADGGAGAWGALATGGDAETMVVAGAGVWGNAASGADGVGGGEPAPFPFMVRDGGRQVSQRGNTARDGGRKTR